MTNDKRGGKVWITSSPTSGDQEAAETRRDRQGNRRMGRGCEAGTCHVRIADPEELARARCAGRRQASDKARSQ